MEVPIRNDDQLMTATPTLPATSKEEEAMSTNPTAESRRPGFWRDITVIIAISAVIIAIFSLAVMGFTSLDSKIDAQSAELRQDNAELRRVIDAQSAELRQDNAEFRKANDAQNAEFRKANDAQNAELRKIVTDTGDKFERLYNALLTERKGD
ncbi:hypothetical protein BO98_00690 [Candidatus Synechococcus spongiarum LMB bulk10D]|nr:hypothetical protein BO98_00690 [Candidatus Synechococcus spongiarum LMB bulk10D]